MAAETSGWISSPNGLNPIPAPAMYVTVCVLPSGSTYEYDPSTMLVPSPSSVAWILFDVL